MTETMHRFDNERMMCAFHQLDIQMIMICLNNIEQKRCELINFSLVR